MEKIYSKIDTDQLLHIIVRANSIPYGRKDIIEPEQYIQCSTLKLNANTTFKPHVHIWKSGPEMCIAQESWVVIKGSVECSFYDIDNTFLCNLKLNAGDASFTLHGGHNYYILEDDTLVYEYKTGPYTGQINDKKFLENDLI